MRTLRFDKTAGLPFWTHAVLPQEAVIIPDFVYIGQGPVHSATMQMTWIKRRPRCPREQ